VGYAVGAGRAGLLAEAVQVQVGILMAAVLLHDLIYYAGSSGNSLGEVPHLMLRYSLGRALYTGAIGLVVAWLISLRRRLSPE